MTVNAVKGGSSADMGESLQYKVTRDDDRMQLIVGPLPQGTTSDQVIVEVSATAVLEISLAGTTAKSITHQLPEGLGDDELLVKFSRKRSTLTVSWAELRYVTGEHSGDDEGSQHPLSIPPGAGGQVTASASCNGSASSAPASSQNSNMSCNIPNPVSAEEVSSPAPGTHRSRDAQPSGQETSCPPDSTLPEGQHATAASFLQSLPARGTFGTDLKGGRPVDSGVSTGDIVSRSPLPEDQIKCASAAKSQKSAKGKKKKGKNKAKQAAPSHQLQPDLNEQIHGLEDLEATADSLAEQLLSRGFGYVDDFLSPEVVKRILAETGPLHDFFEPGEIWVGKEAQAGAQVARDDVRGDSILWMNFATMISNSCHTLHRAMRRMDTLVMNLLPRRVPRLAHVSEHSDAMLSIYPPPSGRFQKHIDNTARDGRCLTVLLYLNTGWTPEMGGALKLWPLKTGQVEGSLITTAAQTLSRGGGVEPVELPPIAGRLAMFYSDRVLHEVLPTRRLRYAVTQWYYDRNERAEALAVAEAAASATPARSGRAVKARSGAAGGMDSQAEAHSFIRALMVDTSDPTPELIKTLICQVEALSSDALRMASQIMGASTPEDLVKAVRGFTPQSLAELRDELSRMGQ